jgi:hypothetical protein
VPTQPSGDAPRIETLSENLEDKSATYLAERIISTPQREEQTETTKEPTRAEQTEIAARTNRAWRDAVAPILSTVLIGADRRAVEQAWQPEHCEALEAVAEALDAVWATAVPMADETTVALRVVGLPAVNAALVVDVADRSTATAREPIALTGELLRFTGVVVCAGTHNAVTCGRLRHELEGVPEVPDEGLVRLLETGFARALTASMSEMTIEDFLGEPGAPPERVRVEAEVGPMPEVPTGPIRESLVATAPPVDGPSSPAIFGG